MTRRETETENARRLRRMLADDRKWESSDNRVIDSFTRKARKSAYRKGWFEGQGQSVMDIGAEM